MDITEKLEEYIDWFKAGHHEVRIRILAYTGRAEPV